MAGVRCAHEAYTVSCDCCGLQRTMEDLRHEVYEFLQRTMEADALLLRLWATSYVDGRVLILHAEAAVALAATDTGGYHAGVWRLATQYEALMARALLTNSNPAASGYQQPKSFTAWPRRHNVALYRQAGRLRARLSPDPSQTTQQARRRYRALISHWHQSIAYISGVSGHTRLDTQQLRQLCVSLRWEP